MRCRQYFVAFLAVIVAAGLWSGQSGAENLDLDEMGSVLVLPVITGDFVGNYIKDTSGDIIIDDNDGVTLATITNAWDQAIILQVDVISGDQIESNLYGGDECQRDSFTCPLTARETTTFVFTDNPDDTYQSTVRVECSKLVKATDGTIVGVDEHEPVATAIDLKAENGIMVVSVCDPIGKTANEPCTINDDIIFGDAIVVDEDEGQAYSFGAISFQAGNKVVTNGDKVLKFDGQEYLKFPSALATNFLAPNADGCDFGCNDVQAELILFTLDFTPGLASPRVHVTGETYNDDEVMRDWEWTFDCFDIVELHELHSFHSWYGELTDGDVPPILDPRGLQSISGHLAMFAQEAATANDQHDETFGDGDGSRNRGVHGWIVQNVIDSSDAVVVTEHQPILGGEQVDVGSDAAAWARPLSQSTTDLVGDGNENPTLNLETNLP